MAIDVKAKAPGKILWLGGYSVLERPNIGFVTSVNRYAYVEVSSTAGNIIELFAPQINANVSAGVDVKTGKMTIEVRQKEFLLLKTAVEVALRYVASLGIRLSGMKLKTKTDDEFAYRTISGKVTKSGLGSSAAVTVAAIKAILQLYGIGPDQSDATHKLSQVAHGLATGKVGSGFDIAAAAHGSMVYTRYSPDIIKSLPTEYTNDDLLELVKKEWDYKMEKFDMPRLFSLMFATFLGEGMATTTAVGSVSKFKEKDPIKYKELIDQINIENEKAIKALKLINTDTSLDDNLQIFKDSFNKGRLLTKALGVLSQVGIEDDDLTRLIDESVSNGAFVAKLPGAGGRDSMAALTINKEDHERLLSFWRMRQDIGVFPINFE